MTTVVVNWSGGPDSTAALQYLLQHTDYRVIAFSVDADESSDVGNRMEAKAIDTLYPIMRTRYRDFELIRATHIRSQKYALMAGEPNVYPILFFLDHPMTQLYIGRCWEDTRINWGEYVYRYWERQKKILDAGGIELVWFNIHKPKRHIRKDLGDLWQLTFSCIMPKEDGTPCEKCIKCKQRYQANWRRRY